MFLSLFNKKKKSADTPNAFVQIISFARDLEANNPQALVDLTRALLRPLQAELIISAIESGEHESRSEVQSHTFFMPGVNNFQTGFNQPMLDPDKFVINLKHDPVLACPWKRPCYVNCLSHIGTGKKSGPWEEDTKNHAITLWLPWGIAFVGGGNHSLATGILAGEGTVKPQEVIDMGQLLDKVVCDGKTYRSIKDERILSKVLDQRRAALFEVGRLIRKNKIIPMKIKI